MSPVLFSSNKDDWATPAYIFDPLNQRFKFTLDVCATNENTKCERFLSEASDGLSFNWDGHTCFMNPPYSQIKKWMEKAYEEFIRGVGTTVVCLVPARTDTKWFHDYVWHYASSIEFFKGRITFEGASHGAPFPSCLVIYDPAAKVQTVGPCLIKATPPSSRTSVKHAEVCGSPA